jgi:hypothetical protein
LQASDQQTSRCTKSDGEIGKFLSQNWSEPGKIGQTAWQNQSDVTKIGSATAHVNWALKVGWWQGGFNQGWALSPCAIIKVQLQFFHNMSFCLTNVSGH